MLCLRRYYLPIVGLGGWMIALHLQNDSMSSLHIFFGLFWLDDNTNLPTTYAYDYAIVMYRTVLVWHH